MSQPAAGPEPASLGPWRETAPGVFLATAEPASVTIGLIVGSERAMIVDTGSSPEQGRAIRASVAQVTDLPLAAAVVTHWHFDHFFGLAAFDDLETIGHESLADRLSAGDPGGLAARLGVDWDTLVVPNRSIAVAAVVDLGERRVEIAHLGRGHTEGDLVVVVADAQVIFVGDLMESAGPPWFGDDSWPVEWPATLDGVIGLMADSRAIPGHGEPVDRDFAFQARGEIGAVAGEIRHLVESGVAENQAVAAGRWPFPDEHVAAGVRRGYAELAGLGIKGTRPTLPLT